MTAPYMVALDLVGRHCVVVGGGAVAERKVAGLRDASAAVTLIAPTLTVALSELADREEITAIRRPYRAGDLLGAFLTVAATDDPLTNQQIAADAHLSGVLVNVVDEPRSGDFTVPAVTHRGSLTVGVSTRGRSPALATRVRDFIAGMLTDDHVALLDRVVALRAEHRHDPPAWRAAFTPAVLARAAAGDVDGAEQLLRSQLNDLDRPRPAPRVSLVGAGPGDPGLLTVRGRERLQCADVVIYDRLVDPRLLDLAPPSAARINVGKRPRGNGETQEYINQLLIEHGHAGRMVVRLKGGDPFVFGRGGEEAAALAAAGIPFEVVPGVSSAIAVPAAAGIPVTHRGVSESVVITTGHDAGTHARDWAALARTGTLVFLMGAQALPQIVSNLLKAGCAPDSPAAAITWGTWATQHTIVSSLAELPERVEREAIGAPMTIVVGQVVALRTVLGSHPEEAR
ncbi:MAG: siroheme synthase CysG [Thermomicrobia bacterium]|nr:siroheme synthase CysG [Thermomicrobia bacterium]